MKGSLYEWRKQTVAGMRRSLAQLDQRIAQLATERTGLEEVIDALEAAEIPSPKGRRVAKTAKAKPKPKGKRRTMSAAARRKISKAMKARWASKRRAALKVVANG